MSNSQYIQWCKASNSIDRSCYYIADGGYNSCAILFRGDIKILKANEAQRSYPQTNKPQAPIRDGVAIRTTNTREDRIADATLAHACACAWPSTSHSEHVCDVGETRQIRHRRSREDSFEFRKGCIPPVPVIAVMRIVATVYAYHT